MADVPVTESSVEERLANYFSPQKSVPQPKQETVQAEEPEPEVPVSEETPAEETQEETQEEVSDTPPDGFVELEHLGNKYFVPPDLKEAFEANRAQGTRATQEVLHVRKALEVERQALQTAQTFNTEIRELDSKKYELLSYKDQAKKLDWSQLTLDQKVDLDRELRKIDEQLVDLDRQIDGKRSEHGQKFSRLVVEAVQSTERYMGQKVQNWTVDTGKALHEYGLNNGIPTEKLTTGWFADPVATHIMWKAQQWDKLQGSKPSVANKASNAPPVIKPGSNAVQKSVASSNYQKARQNLKKTGSLDDFAQALLAGQRKR